MSDSKTILLTGATGYVGGRLGPRLLTAGYRVRCLVREPRKLEARSWARDPRVEVIACDLMDEDRVAEVASGCETAYYLVHSMVAAGSDFRSGDQALATVFARAMERAGVERIIYLGGLGELGTDLSEHLTSRFETETALRSTRVPVTALRAAMIIGSGSASFEILRYLVERLPVMITPRWVKTRSQPISITNVLNYLVMCLDEPRSIGQILDIGGTDVVTYRELMDTAAESLGLRKRVVIPVPLLTPRLSSLWIHLVTPIAAALARPLAEGLRNEVVCRDDRAAEWMPQQLQSVREAIDDAVQKAADNKIETKWSDAGPIPGDPEWSGGTVFTDQRTIEIAASARATYLAICRVGGGHGWYAADGLWRLRGFLDRLVGGPGLRRGRRNREEVAFGDALDFWRVTDIERDKRLELRAEMKLPGIASLEFTITTDKANPQLTKLVQTARFKPRGLAGLVYWYTVLPLHSIVFRGMSNGIRRAAERIEQDEITPNTASISST